MNTYTLDKDINTICVTAKSFPDDITGAFDRLRALLPDANNRTLYGISRPENGKIVYRAAAEGTSAEAEQLNAESFTIKAGKYITETIHDWQAHMEQIASTFQALLDHPNIDPIGVCVEWYKSDKELVCMVRVTT
jgi:predicted transcriptional regulator YdeE